MNEKYLGYALQFLDREIELLEKTLGANLSERDIELLEDTEKMN